MSAIACTALPAIMRLASCRDIGVVEVTHLLWAEELSSHLLKPSGGPPQLTPSD